MYNVHERGEHDFKNKNEPDFKIYHFINIIKLNMNYLLIYNLLFVSLKLLSMRL